MRTRTKNQFGVELAIFCARRGLTIRDVARACEVKYDTLLYAANGRTAGHELIPKVRAYMEAHVNDPKTITA